ncbi:MAG: hypothetical protein M1358_12930 [Chloroflexi bacterium]|nr:hypothetical protein [Chloroflexota bacterium]
MKIYRAPDVRRTSGNIAAVHAQIAIVALVVVGQLWLLTVGLDLLLSGDTTGAVTSAVVSGLGFLISLGAILAYRE